MNNKRRTPQLRKRSREVLRARWDATLAGIIEMSRVLSYNLDANGIWDAMLEHLSLSFETTSFFVALYNAERDRLEFPLVSEDGMRINHEPIPLCGMSRVIMVHGVEFNIQDFEAERERLQAAGLVADEREPGGFARSWLGVPLRSRQSEVMGLIALQHTLPNRFSDHDLSLLLAVAAPLSLALDNLHLSEIERERRLIAGALMEIGQLSGASLDYDEVLERILDQLQRVVTYDSAMITLPPGEDEHVLIISASHDPETFPRGDSLRYSAISPMAQALVSEQPVVVSDADNFAAWWEGKIPAVTRLRSWLILPMTIHGKSDLIILSKFEPSGYTQKDASNAFALARQGAIALETARLQAESQINLQMLQQRARRLTSINRINSVITSSLDKDEVLRTTAQLLTELFEADHCGIVMLIDGDDYATLAAEYPRSSNEGLRIRILDNATLDWLIHYGTAIAIEDLETGSDGDPSREALLRTGTQSALIAPLIVRDRVIGMITIDMTRSRRQFTGEECETLVTIAGQVTMAVAHANLYEAALAVNRLRSAFLANMSHELRTPLNAIIGYSDMLLSEFYGALNEQQMDRLGRVNTSGKQLLSMIDDVLDLSKLEAGQITLALRSTHASDVLEDVLATIRPSITEKALALEVSIAPDELLVRADPRYLHQIMTNLLKNAVKFTAEGGIEVRLFSVRFQGSRSETVTPPQQVYVPDGDWLALLVSDTGIGIKPEDHLMIFESFRQVDGSTIREYDGPGLGLAITRQLVELHEGFVWVESTLGVGSTFVVLLPTVKPGLIEDLDLATFQRDTRPLVLVIDDGPADRQLLRDYLGEAEYQVICTANPTAALDLVRQLQPDLVITDVMMPEASGWDVLRDLKADQTTARVPVIVLSVLDQKMMGYGLGAADYLVKPVDRETLRAQVQRTLDKAGE